MAKVKNKYPWSDNLSKAPLIEPHTAIKHSIVNDYLRSYLKVVANPQASHIRLSIIDGFCGGGLYSTDSGSPHYGTPIIILKALREALSEIVADRVLANVKRELSIECDVYFIDKDINAIKALRIIAAEWERVDAGLPLTLRVHYVNDEFANVFSDILRKVGNSKAIFLLDPCGYSEVPLDIIKTIMKAKDGKREVIWTFMIDAMLTYATEESQALINSGYEKLLSLFKKEDQPTGFCVQKEIFSLIKDELGVPFFTPFAIKQSKGWDYWLIHLAYHHRASEVMKEVEHRHADQREHYGSPGLNMMAAAGDAVYLFREDDIKRGKNLLLEQIPQQLAAPKYSDGILFTNFMHLVYNETPLTSGAIKDVLVAHDDLEILTSTGGSRRSSKRIKTGDRIRLKRQTRLFLNYY